MTPEQRASQDVRLRASQWGMKLFRNNSGVLMNPANIPVRFGLGNESKRINKIIKSSDFIGVFAVTITPEMVGKTVGVFAAIEAKADGFVEREEYPEGSREKAQKTFIDLVKTQGGLAGFATNASDVDKLTETYFSGLIK